MVLSTNEKREIIELLNNGAIGIMPTDTIYGIHCKAFRPDLISKIIDIKKRDTNKPFITLISDIKELELLDIDTNRINNILNEYWPGPNTLILTNRNNESLGVRLPMNDFLISIIKETGPLISTSANISGELNINSIADAFKIFSNKIDFYVDSGLLNNTPSSIYIIENNLEIKKIR